MGWIFNLDASNVCRLIKKLIPLLWETADSTLRFALALIKRKRRKMGFEQFIKTYPDIVKLVIDSTEQKHQRPVNKRKQKNFYLGKKHQHGLKTQIVVDKRGRIINISKTYPAIVYDKTLLIKEKTLDKLPEDLRILLDKGYKKIEKLYPSHVIFIPIKRNRWKRTLTYGEKIKNTPPCQKESEG